MYTVQIDPDIERVVRKVAKDQCRPFKSQVRFWLEKSMKSEGYSPEKPPKKEAVNG